MFRRRRRNKNSEELKRAEDNIATTWRRLNSNLGNGSKFVANLFDRHDDIQNVSNGSAMQLQNVEKSTTRTQLINRARVQYPELECLVSQNEYERPSENKNRASDARSYGAARDNVLDKASESDLVTGRSGNCLDWKLKVQR